MSVRIGFESRLSVIVAGGLTCVLMSAGACGPEAGPPAVGEPVEASIGLTEVASAAGLDFTAAYGGSFSGLSPLLLEPLLQLNMGTGAAVGDVDGDGDLDVYLLAQFGLANRLMRNDLDAGAKRFTDATEAAGVGDTGLGRMAHFADLDNDGLLDLLVINDDRGDESSRSRVFRNDGLTGGTPVPHFTDVTEGSGFRPMGYLRCGSALGDYDGDGLLDIYVTIWTYTVTNDANFPGSNRLYRNLGGFRFEDVTEAVGLPALNRDSFTAVFADFDEDGDPDLFVAVDHTSDEFYRNDGLTGGTPVPHFTTATAEVGTTHWGNDMGVACADVDDDGDLDLYATNITDASGVTGNGRYNVFNVNRLGEEGRLRFTDVATLRGVEDSAWGWGTDFTDVDNDGDLDLVAVDGMDGYVKYAALFGSSVYQAPSYLFVNDGTAHFTRVVGTDLDAPADSRGLVVFDYDRDGDEDLLVTNIDQPVQLFENTGVNQNHWLGVALTQPAGLNRFGVGATVFATTGGVTRRRDILAGESYLAGTPAEVHFGLGPSVVIDQLRVRWTDGLETTFENVAADRLLHVTRESRDDPNAVTVTCFAGPGAGFVACEP